MKLPRSSLILMAVATFGMSSTWAHTITYRFTGSVTNIDVTEGDPPLGIPHPAIGTPFEGTFTYDLNASGTPFSTGEGGVVNGMEYSSPVPPGRMRIRLAGANIESTGGSSVLVADGISGNLIESNVDFIVFAAGVQAALSLVVRLEDTTQSTFDSTALPAWVALPRFDLRNFEIFQSLPSGFAHRYLTLSVRTFEPIARNAAIDVLPERYPNRINLAERDRISVAVLSLAATANDVAFDATAIDSSSIRFGALGFEAAPVSHRLQDADGDGDTDLLLHFRIDETGIRCSTKSALLSGFTTAGRAVQGSDSVRPIRCNERS